MTSRAITDKGMLSDAIRDACPSGVTAIMRAIADGNRNAWLVGGCVRDVARGAVPRDWNVVTDMPVDVVRAMAEGNGFGVEEDGAGRKAVLLRADGMRCDVTSFTEHAGDAGGTGIDGLIDNLARRDFTINAMAWSERHGVVDLSDGLGDLEARVLRCPGDPYACLWHDPVRIVRAMRFAATMGLTVEGRLSDAMHAICFALSGEGIDGRRVFEELAGMLEADDADRLATMLLDYRDVVFEIIPELRAGDGLRQVTQWHRLSVYEHIVDVVRNVKADRETRLAALLHDVGKPACMTVDDDGTMHFKGHPRVSADITDRILSRMGCDEGMARSVRSLVDRHDAHPDPSRRGVGQVMRDMGSREEFDRWLDLYHADVMGQSEYAQGHSLPEISRIGVIAEAMRHEGCPVSVSELAISAEDVAGMGRGAGDVAGQGVDAERVLGEVLESVMSGETDNDRDALVSKAEEVIRDMGDASSDTGSATPAGSRRLRGVSLYSGAGGVDVGFERAGVDVVWANELIADFARTYELNHPDSEMHAGDIHDQMDSLDDLKDIDIVFGGPPCQAFSVAGKMDPDDPRGQLIFTFLDVVGKVRPRCFVMENVKALGEMRRWERVRARYMDKARALGYVCHRFTLSAADYGVPQKRERTFFIGVRDDVCDGNDFEEEIRGMLLGAKRPARTVRDAIGDLGAVGTDAHPDTCPARITFARHPIMRSTPYAGMYFNGQGRPIDLDGLANTLPASMGGNRTPIIDDWWLHGKATEDWVEGYLRGLRSGKSPKAGEAPSRLRRMTIKEAMRVQTFPDDYQFVGSNTSIYKQIGNAVPCDFAEAVAKVVAGYLTDGVTG